MVDLGDIFRRYGPAYRQKHGARMLPSHRAAMRAIEQCRTAALGGRVYYCPACDQVQYRYHSCRNRHCPQCQQQATEDWLVRQQQLLLPVPYFLLTFTLPAELRKVAQSHQKELYTLLFRSAAAATQELAQDTRFVGGQIGMLGVLHTWTRDLRYHPHVHFLVPGGGLAVDQQHWLPSGADFLVHVRPLAVLFRAKFRAALRQTNLFAQAPPTVWQRPWVVHCKAVGNGKTALKYLAPYIFRVALSNTRLVSAEDGQVSFRYTDRESGQERVCTLPAQEFMRRFLQHVLPKGFVKVRYYGFFSSGNRPRLRQIRRLLGVPPSPPPALAGASEDRPHCPTCDRTLLLLEFIPRPKSRPP